MTVLLHCSMNHMRACSPKVNLTVAETSPVLTEAKIVIYHPQLGEAARSGRFGGSPGPFIGPVVYQASRTRA
jgi:hypothetical protein